MLFRDRNIPNRDKISRPFPGTTLEWVLCRCPKTTIQQTTLAETKCTFSFSFSLGNSWGSDATGSGLGHGPQEQFYGCSDIAILRTCDKFRGNPNPRGLLSVLTGPIQWSHPFLWNEEPWWPRYRFFVLPATLALRQCTRVDCMFPDKLFFNRTCLCRPLCDYAMKTKKFTSKNDSFL